MIKKSVVLYGPENHGKSTLLGYILTKTANIDVEKQEKFFERELENYQPILFYTWVINSKQTLIPQKTTDDLTGETIVKLEFNVNGKTIEFNQRQISLPTSEILFFDTPGDDGYAKNRDLALHAGDVGVFCVEISEVLKDSFDKDFLDRYNVWPIFSGQKPIIVLTKIDLNDHLNEKDIKDATARLLSLTGYDNDTIVVPTYVKGDEKRAINVMEKDTTVLSWYQGMCLIDAIADRINS